MRNVLLLSFALLTAPMVQAQAPTGAPQPAPAVPRRPAAPMRSTLGFTVTDARGATLGSIHVEVLGQLDRRGDTDQSGQIRFANVPAGTFRVRFSGENVITLEREVTVRAGQPIELTITLNPAPEPEAPSPPPPAPTPPPPAPPAPPVTGPVGQPQAVSIVDLLEKEYVGARPRRESLVSCSGSTRTMMIQLNEPQPNRMYESADSTYYVIGGEGTVRLNGEEKPLQTNSFVSVPRGVAHSFTRRGRRPLILLATLSGEPCEQPR